MFRKLSTAFTVPELAFRIISIKKSTFAFPARMKSPNFVFLSFTQNRLRPLRASAALGLPALYFAMKSFAALYSVYAVPKFEFLIYARIS